MINNIMVKENLIVVPAFPTNSIVLKGLIEYLNDYFSVHCVNLPGFIKRETPLKIITVRSFADFLDKRIKELNLDHYIIAGISLGVLIINNARLNEGCKGIIAAEPYLNSQSVNISKIRLLFYRAIIKLICFFRLCDNLWNEKLFYRLGFFRDHPKWIRKAIFNEIDATTFFKTGGLLSSSHLVCRFHNIPHVLLANPNDKRIKYSYVSETFRKGVKNLLIINIDIPHFPSEIDKEYFELNFDKENLLKIMNFLNLKTRSY